MECCGTGAIARPAGIQEAARLTAPSGSPRTAICWQARGDVDLHFDLLSTSRNKPRIRHTAGGAGRIRLRMVRASGCSSSTVPDGSSARECFVESQEGPQRFVGRARVRKPGSYVRLQDPQKGRSSGGFARQPAAPCPAPVVSVHVAFRELCGINLLPHISSSIVPFEITKGDRRHVSTILTRVRRSRQPDITGHHTTYFRPMKPIEGRRRRGLGAAGRGA